MDAIAESGGTSVARTVSRGRMPIAAWTSKQQQGHGQKGQSPWWQGAGPSPPLELARVGVNRAGNARSSRIEARQRKV
jgi:hypothetical protein